MAVTPVDETLVSPAPPAPPTVETETSVAAALLRTARPRQWTKNVLVFAAPGAAGILTHGSTLPRALASFGLFCAVASGTYFVNDVADVRADRSHPTKRYRPVAAGNLKPRTAVIVGAVLMAAGIGLGAALNGRLALVLVAYVGLQVGYSLYFKHQPVLDLVAVAGGFVLRGIAGAVAIPVRVSEWFLIVATFGSLLLVAGKRLGEHLDLGDARGEHRATLDVYSTAFLRGVVFVSVAGASIGYCLWAFDLQTALIHHDDAIWFQLSIVPMLVALLHFTYLIDRGQAARPEDLVLRDRTLQVLGLIWLFLFALGVYGV
jgi:decaprenyl-phosphate phosphoribosyltransferase